MNSKRQQAVTAIKAQVTPEQVTWTLEDLPKAERLAETDRTAFSARAKLYWLVNGQLARACEIMDYPLRQWEWPDSAPLEAMAEVFEGIETTEWYQGHLGMIVMPVNNPLFLLTATQGAQ